MVKLAEEAKKVKSFEYDSVSILKALLKSIDDSDFTLFGKTYLKASSSDKKWCQNILQNKFIKHKDFDIFKAIYCLMDDPFNKQSMDTLRNSIKFSDLKVFNLLAEAIITEAKKVESIEYPNFKVFKKNYDSATIPQKTDFLRSMWPICVDKDLYDNIRNHILSQIPKNIKCIEYDSDSIQFDLLPSRNDLLISIALSDLTLFEYTYSIASYNNKKWCRDILNTKFFNHKYFDSFKSICLNCPAHSDKGMDILIKSTEFCSFGNDVSYYDKHITFSEKANFLNSVLLKNEAEETIDECNSASSNRLKYNFLKAIGSNDIYDLEEKLNDEQPIKQHILTKCAVFGELYGHNIVYELARNRLVNIGYEKERVEKMIKILCKIVKNVYPIEKYDSVFIQVDHNQTIDNLGKSIEHSDFEAFKNIYVSATIDQRKDFLKFHDYQHHELYDKIQKHIFQKHS